MPLPETVGPVARNKWELVMVPFQLANRGLVRGCLLVQFPQLIAASLVLAALVDLQCGALLMGKGRKNSPLIHRAGNHRHQLWRSSQLMVPAYEVCFVAAPVPAQCTIS
ncbi:hypothetical protein PVL29_019635 [Vitis rotundifolia]|uniref:Uncharacterized protein n=1 Tax=Vitis rotundifolia TaxID=103349 RepID=A0AA38Z0Z8_VITRO|nr:hypothetical protein PVL29_019635 [Vitis rotundifolia]